jgi:hypothetical protein
MMKMPKIFGLIALLIATQAFAAVSCSTNINPTGVLGGDASGYLQGCLTEPTGLTDNPGTPAWNGAYIAWKITPLGDGSGYLYEYTWSATSKAVSHIILGLSDNCTATSGCLWDISSTSIFYGTWGPGPSNPGFPTGADFWGIKFDNTTGTSYDFSFKSNRVPVWQNFYAKDGADSGTEVYAYNTGLGVTGTSYYVAAPDSVIPEPGFYGLLSLGLAGLYLAARRRRSVAK